MEMVHDKSRSPKEYQYNVAYSPITPDLTNRLSPGWNDAETKNIANFFFLAGKNARYLAETKFKIIMEKKDYILCSWSMTGT